MIGNSALVIEREVDVYRSHIAMVTVLCLTACEPPTGAPSDATEPPAVAAARGGGGNGGNGGGVGGPGGPSPILVLVFRATTTSGLANALQGDGRDIDGSPTANGESRYSNGPCGVTLDLEQYGSSGADTTRVSIHLAESLKRKDPCVGGARSIGFALPPNPVFSTNQSVGGFQWKWEPDRAVSSGDQTDGLGKINVRNQPSTCSPLRYNPLKYDGLFSASDFVRVERIEGGWRLFTAPSPQNVAQCEDRSSAGGNGASEAGETIPLDFELLVDENAGDGIGPVG